MANPQPDKFVLISVELFEAIMKTHFPGTARMVFDYIIRMTYGFHKKEFQTTHCKIAKDLNLKRERVSEAIYHLKTRKIINGTEKRTVLERNSLTTLSIQKNYELWINGTENRTGTEKRTDNGTENRTHILLKKKENKRVSENGTEKRTEKRFIPPTGDYLKNNGTPWIDFQAWDEWVQYRKEKKKPLSPSSVKKQLQLLSSYKQRQREIIDTAIRSEWQGLFPPKGRPQAEQCEIKYNNPAEDMERIYGKS